MQETENKIVYRTYFNKTLPYQDQKPFVTVEDKTDDSNNFKCSYCHIVYCTETELEHHETRSHRHKTSSNKTYSCGLKCGLCCRDFNSKSETYAHYTRYHLYASQKSNFIDRKTFICNLCDGIFYNKKLLSVHLNLRHDFEGTKTCPICNKTYLKIMNAHLNYQHELTHVSTCPNCLKNFDSRQQMLKHMDELHRFRRRNLDKYEVGNRKFTDKYFNITERYFVQPKKRPVSYPRSLIHGAQIHVKAYLCVICREICYDNKSKFFHLVKNHDFGADSFSGIKLKIMDPKRVYVEEKRCWKRKAPEFASTTKQSRLNQHSVGEAEVDDKSGDKVVKSEVNADKNEDGSDSQVDKGVNDVDNSVSDIDKAVSVVDKAVNVVDKGASDVDNSVSDIDKAVSVVDKTVNVVDKGASDVDNSGSDIDKGVIDTGADDVEDCNVDGTDDDDSFDRDDASDNYIMVEYLDDGVEFEGEVKNESVEIKKEKVNDESEDDEFVSIAFRGPIKTYSKKK